jgi:hypothetical protein
MTPRLPRDEGCCAVKSNEAFKGEVKQIRMGSFDSDKCINKLLFLAIQRRRMSSGLSRARLLNFDCYVSCSYRMARGSCGT